MINKKFIQQLRKKYLQHEGERRQIISLSNTVLHDSKRVIFSLHRSDMEKAKNKLEEIEKILKNLSKKFGSNRVEQEGAYRAATEEYVEAKTFYLYKTDKKIDKIKGIELTIESYLGGMSDLAGELVRVAINQVSAGNLKEVKKAKKAVDEIMAELVEFDMTGYLRTKYDQARGHMRKMEQINYEMEIRK